MREHASNDRERWEELEVARLLEGLSPEEQAEYEQLNEALPADQRSPGENGGSWEEVVAALDLAWSDGNSEPLPEHLHRAIAERAKQELAQQDFTQRDNPSGTATVGGAEASRETSPARGAVVPVRRAEDEAAAAFRLRDAVPWFISAACLLLALGIWFANRPAAESRPDWAQRRAELLASSEEVVQAVWSEGPTPVAGAAGDVVWSPRRQEGYLRFRGLPVNTPTEAQYQLWIFDKNQSEATPVDGGVFDITASGEVIIPIDAKLQVEDPYMFAITIEKPGGVVVSSRERLPLIATVE